MAENDEYTVIYGDESWGQFGAIGIRISIKASRIDIKSIEEFENEYSKRIRYAAMDAARLIKEELIAKVVNEDNEARKSAEQQRSEILSCFSDVGLIFAEEIPNGYCGNACCRHLPWFVVTTVAGRFKIGWRKRVISIEWEDKRIKADDLFKDEDVTKLDNGIHAWSIDKAKSYVYAVVSNILLLNQKKES